MNTTNKILYSIEEFNSDYKELYEESFREDTDMYLQMYFNHAVTCQNKKATLFFLERGAYIDGNDNFAVIQNLHNKEFLMFLLKQGAYPNYKIALLYLIRYDYDIIESYVFNGGKLDFELDIITDIKDGKKRFMREYHMKKLFGG